MFYHINGKVYNQQQFSEYVENKRTKVEKVEDEEIKQ